MSVKKTIMKSSLALLSAGIVFTSTSPGFILAAENDINHNDVENVDLENDEEIVSSVSFYKDENGNWVDESEVPMSMTDQATTSGMEPLGLGQPTEIVVAQYLLSTTETAELADNMRMLASEETSRIINALTLIPYVGGLISVAANNDVARSIRNEVIEAADDGFRVRVTIYDYEEYSTSYSQRVVFTTVI